MIIKEGMITITPEEKNTIHKYISSLCNHINKQFEGDGRTISYSVPIVIIAINDYSDKINPFGIPIKYIFSIGNSNASFNNKTKTITINVISVAKYSRPSVHTFDYSDYSIWGIRKEDLIPLFIHEYIHYKQNTARTEKSGPYNISKNWSEKGIYLTRPWENQAWAAEYIEYLRNRMKIKNPKQILNQLRKMGVMHNPDLEKLKKQDIQAWKRVMKNAIMYALQSSNATQASPKTQ